jgi:hypothetical protein
MSKQSVQLRICHSVYNIWEQVKMIFMKNLRTEALKLLTNVYTHLSTKECYYTS